MGRQTPYCVGAAAANGDTLNASDAALGTVAQGAVCGLYAGVRKWLTSLLRSQYDKEIWSISIPILCASLLVPLSSAVDAAVVGRLGSAQLGGVGIAGLSTTLLQSSFAFLAVLSTPVVARAVARKDDEVVSQTIAQNLWMAVAIGLLVSIFLFVGAESIVGVLKPSVAVRPFAIVYLRCLAFFGPSSFAFQTLNGIYRGLKDTKSTLTAAVCSALINLVLDFFFVFGLKWGVAGAAGATVISVWFAAIYLIGVLLWRGQLKFKHALSVPPLGSVLKLLRRGFALSLRNLTALGTVFFASVAASRLNVTLYAAFEISRQFFSMAYLSYSHFDFTAQALCASYLGKKDKRSAWLVFQRTVQLAMMLSAVSAMVLTLSASTLGRLFTTEPAVLAAFSTLAPQLFLCVPIESAVAVLDGALIAAQKTDYVAYGHIASSLVGLLMLASVVKTGNLSLFTAWLCVRVGFAGRGIFTFYKLFLSKSNPYALGEAKPATQVQGQSL